MAVICCDVKSPREAEKGGRREGNGERRTLSASHLILSELFKSLCTSLFVTQDLVAQGIALYHIRDDMCQC